MYVGEDDGLMSFWYASYPENGSLRPYNDNLALIYFVEAATIFALILSPKTIRHHR